MSDLLTKSSCESAMVARLRHRRLCHNTGIPFLRNRSRERRGLVLCTFQEDAKVDMGMKDTSHFPEQSNLKRNSKLNLLVLAFKNKKGPF